LAEVSRGAAFGDVDNDGDTDFLVTNNNGPARLFLNQIGNRSHWLGLRLVAKSGRDMLGAQVEIVVDENQVLRRRVRSDGSYLSSNDLRPHFGLGDSTDPGTAEIHWPSGAKESIQLPAVDRIYTIEEGKGITSALCDGKPCAVTPARSAAKSN